MKSTQKLYNEIERFEKKYEPVEQANFDTPFKASCTHQT